MKKLLLSAIAAFCGLTLALLSNQPAFAERRVALVIGNSAYRNVARLPNTINDANAIAALFKNAGFDIVEARQNLGVVEFKRAIRDFMNSTRDADIAAVYYAGHGIEAGGTNYLIPIDARLASDYDAEDEAVLLDRVILALQPAKRLRLIILDACRDNPFVTRMQRAVAVRAVVNGLAKVEPMTTDTLVAYAAKAGQVSSDGEGPNSPFTAALVKHIAEPGLDIRIAFGRVRDEVLKVTGNRQEPFVYGSLGGGTISLVPAPEPKVEPPLLDSNLAGQRDYELAERVGTRAAWESFLSVHKSGFYAELARAQLAKLAPQPPAPAAQSRPGQPPTVADREQRERADREQAAALQARRGEPVRVNPGDDTKRANPAPERPNTAERQPALPPQVNVQSTSPPQQFCDREEERLVRLRANPVPDEVARFARELTCGQLRAQVLRLLESVSPASPAGPAPTVSGSRPAVGPASTAGQASAASPNEERRTPAEAERQMSRDAPVARAEAGTRTEPRRQDEACKRDEDRLTRLRANPAREDIVRFQRDLKCEALRPQVLRLLESVGG